LEVEVKKLWVIRTLILVVLFWNLQCAFSFLLRPADYMSGFELADIQGKAVILGFGVLFLMWNVPYMVALYDPMRFVISLMEAFVMQVIGVVGETGVYLQIPIGHSQLQSSILRFVIFDGAGVFLLLAAMILTLIWRKKISQ
jgi:membrane-anchored glycerophosphoryl diester phosphodiesterase (GDPDase)